MEYAEQPPPIDDGVTTVYFPCNPYSLQAEGEDLKYS